MTVLAEEVGLEHPPLCARLFRRIQARWQTIVVFVPYLWMLFFFLFPFFIVAKISLAESIIASPPFSQLLQWSEDGILTIRLVIDNFVYVLEDELYANTYINSVKIAAISTAICLLLLFTILADWIGWPSTRGFTTITIAHITFSLAYVAVIIQSRLTGMAQDLEEAALDLGARPLRVLADITLPRLAPGMVAGWLLAFTLSLDNLVIASFVTGPGSNTLPILIYSRIRLGLRPDINALATIIILAVATGVAIAAYLMLRQQKIAAAEAAAR